MSTTHVLLDRFARLLQARAWARGLNPAQAAALDYLARANRFSRAPSHVADYLGTTRGTASQTLQALARKGFILAEGSEADRRSVSYQVTAEGQAAASDDLPEGLDAAERAVFERMLERLVRGLAADGRTFGLCAGCRHHREGPSCALLGLALLPGEAGQLCHEHQPG